MEQRWQGKYPGPDHPVYAHQYRTGLADDTRRPARFLNAWPH
jgi:hypothetical protein